MLELLPNAVSAGRADRPLTGFYFVNRVAVD